MGANPRRAPVYTTHNRSGLSHGRVPTPCNSDKKTAWKAVDSHVRQKLELVELFTGHGAGRLESFALTRSKSG